MWSTRTLQPKRPRVCFELLDAYCKQLQLSSQDLVYLWCTAVKSSPPFLKISWSFDASQRNRWHRYESAAATQHGLWHYTPRKPSKGLLWGLIISVQQVFHKSPERRAKETSPSFHKINLPVQVSFTILHSLHFRKRQEGKCYYRTPSIVHMDTTFFHNLSPQNGLYISFSNLQNSSKKGVPQTVYYYFLQLSRKFISASDTAATKPLRGRDEITISIYRWAATAWRSYLICPWSHGSPATQHKI